MKLLLALILGLTNLCSSQTTLKNVFWDSETDIDLNYKNLRNSVPEKVTHLRISRIKLTNDDLTYIGSLKNLKSLTLGLLPEGVFIEDLNNLTQLKKLQNLTYLSLSLHKVNIENLSFIPELKLLETLTIHSPINTNIAINKQFCAKLLKNKNLKSLEIFDGSLKKDIKDFVYLSKQKKLSVELKD